MSSSADRRPARARRRIPRGWVPDQHGAWAMLATPPLVGAIVGGASWWHLLLAAAWLSAYCTFYAAGQWLRSGRKRRYLPPLLGHGAVLLVLGGALLIARPGLLHWAPAYAVLLAVSLVCSARRADRSWLNDIVTVLAACLMTPVAAGLGHDDWAGSRSAWIAAGLLAAYFLGTVPYVKTMIRERGNVTVYRVSLGYHVVLLLAALEAAWVPRTAWQTWLLVPVAVGLLLRAGLMPRRGRVRPAVVGAGEVVATVLVGAATLAIV
ncbi:YwiC-like family protein [Cellulomonas sp. NPDC089187]|uniref:YwiC-like family protein n=1 Tax=Cellulomonas sp. NPDC089187 TaxID=3154970 RepID=UPI00341C3F44